MHRLILNRDIYTEVLQQHVPQAKRFLWVITADIKDLYVELDGSFQPLLALFAQLVEAGVAIRLIHAKEPGPRFREEFDRYPRLHSTELFERVLCPRVHTKALIIDGKLAFVGSANLTGAGLGSKSVDKRNFEAGFLFDDPQQIDQLMDWADALFIGDYCHSCKRRDYCPDPIADL